MEILDVLLKGNKCDILTKKGSEEIKYTLSLTNPKLERYLDMFLQKQKKLLDEAKSNLESDYHYLKVRNNIMIYGIATIIALIILSFVAYAGELIGVLGFAAVVFLFLIAHFVLTSIEYEKDPEKEKIVKDILLKIDQIQDIKTIAFNKINAEEKAKKQKLEEKEKAKKHQEYEKMKEEAETIIEKQNLKTLASSKLLPNELNYFDEIVSLASQTLEYKEVRLEKCRKMLQDEFFEMKKQHKTRSNMDLLKELKNKYTKVKNKK